MTAYDIGWNIDVDEAVDELMTKTVYDAAELLGVSSVAFASMSEDERRGCAETEFNHNPVLMERVMDLPDEIEVPDCYTEEDDEDIANWISSAYGFCIYDFALK